MESTLTKSQAFRAMFHMLDELYQENPRHELGGVLGDMQLLQDGAPADQAYVGRWDEAVDKVLMEDSEPKC